jgi:hypothetical protein
MDLVDIIINQTKWQARVIEYSSTPSTKNPLRDVFNRPLKPFKIILTCPDCGSQITKKLRYADNPPYNIDCETCNTPAEKINFFVIDPFKSGRLKKSDIFKTHPKEELPVLEEGEILEHFAFMIAENQPVTPLPSDLGIEEYDEESFNDEDLLD